MTTAATTPSVFRLLPYQQRFLADRTRFKIGLWSRQTGKSFTSAMEAVLDCAETPGTLWVVLSAGERQALEWMQKAKLIAEAYGLVSEMIGDKFQADFAQLTIRFPNGSRIIGLPANERTARGYSANVILDEFAFHDDSRGIWRGLLPSITRQDGKGRERRLIVLSTPNGQSNVFYELWARHPEFGHHKVTILDAVADGMKADPEALRHAIDPDGWQQEYLCEFIDEASALLTYEMIAACESQSPFGSTDPAAEIPPGAPLYVGMDIGRKRDLTVIWTLQSPFGSDVHYTVEVRVLEKCPFRDQLEILSAILRNPHVRRCCIDSTGIGAMLAEEAQRLYGVYRVEAVQFTQASKEEMATGMLRAFQDRTVRIPHAPEIREDLHKIRKVTTAAGNVRYLADRDDAGHADRFWALALALHAGATGEVLGPSGSLSPASLNMATAGVWL